MNHNTKLRHRIIAGTMSMLMLFSTVAASLADVKANGVALADSQTVVTSGDSSTTAESPDQSFTVTTSPDIDVLSELDSGTGGNSGNNVVIDSNSQLPRP